MAPYFFDLQEDDVTLRVVKADGDDPLSRFFISSQADN